MTLQAHDKRKMLFHPVRIRILTEFTGRELTTRQLQAALPSVPQASLYRHVRTLTDAGMLEVAQTEVVNGATERTYRLAEGAARMRPEEMAEFSADDHLQAFSVFAASLIDAVGEYTPSMQDPAREGFSYRRATVYLTDAERAEFEQGFGELAARFLSKPPGPGRKRFLIASATVPDSHRDDAKEGT